MVSRALQVLDAAFGHPRGLLGRLGGAVMARGNAERERRAVQRAELCPGDQIPVVGSGPGSASSPRRPRSVPAGTSSAWIPPR